MMYLSVIDKTLGKTVCGPMAMTGHWTKSSGDANINYVGNESTAVIGEDIVVNYIGNGNIGITHDELEIRIEGKGKSTGSAASFDESTFAPHLHGVLDVPIAAG